MTRTFGDLRRENDKWVISNLEPHVRIKLKAIFTKIAKTDVGPYRFATTNAVAADLAWFESRYPLRCNDADREALTGGVLAFEAQQQAVARVFEGNYTPRELRGLKPGQTIRPHQQRNIELLAMTGGLLVADDVGKGKTYTGGGACLLPGALPATIVCPPHLALQWRRKLEEFTTLSCHVVTKTRPYQLPAVDVRIFGFTQLAGWIDVLEDLGTGLACFDEGHSLRAGPFETDKGRAAARLVEFSRYKLMLTATPVFNYGNEIWNLLYFVRPEVLGDYADFVQEWCSTGRVVKDPVALGAYLREQHAYVRESGSEPKANRIVQSIPYDADRMASAADALAALAHKVRTGTFHERGEAARMLDLRVRHETGLAKAPFVAQLVRAFIEETGEPVMLFGWHRDVYDVWLDQLGDLGCVMYTGSETVGQKEKMKARFLAGEAKVFIISLRSGEGLDGLQHCCGTAIFGELDWSPAVHDQGVGRLNREGQKRWGEGRQVDAIFLVADDGSDPPMLEMNGLKASQAEGVNDLGLTPRRKDVDLSPIERLIARYAPQEDAA